MSSTRLMLLFLRLLDYTIMNSDVITLWYVCDSSFASLKLWISAKAKCETMIFDKLSYVYTNLYCFIEEKGMTFMNKVLRLFSYIWLLVLHFIIGKRLAPFFLFHPDNFIGMTVCHVRALNSQGHHLLQLPVFEWVLKCGVLGKWRPIYPGNEYRFLGKEISERNGITVTLIHHKGATMDHVIL